MPWTLARRADVGRLAGLLALAVSASLGCTTLAAETFPDPAFAADTRAYLGRIEKLGFAGVVAIATPEGPLLSQGFGLADREAGRRWEPATVSTIGSITKQFTAALVLRLEEERLLSVQDPMARYLDGVPPDKQGITLHHLLTHTSGIEDLEDAGDWDPIGREEFVRRALAAPLSAPPGERYAYSNAGYSLLGAIVEKLTGHSYEQALRERVLEPAGLRETGYVLPGWDKARFAQGYRAGERWGTVLERPLDKDGPFWVLRANGGIHSTSEEMLRWARALMDGRVLSAESRRKLWTPHVDESNGRGESFYGYGWVVMQHPSGVRVVTHNGGNGIHFADLALIPDRGFVAFVQTNVVADYPGAGELLTQVGARLLSGMAYPAVPEVVAMPAESLRGFEGAYAGPGDERYDVRADGGTLRLLPRGVAAFARLHAPDRPAARVEDRCRATGRLVAAALRADYAPMQAAYGPTVPLQTLRETWEGRWKQAAERLGPLERHEVLGLASAERDRDRVYVRFVHERGELQRAFVWDSAGGGRLLGIGMRPFEPAARLFPTGERRFATFDSVTGRSVPVRFETAADGAPRLLLGATGHEIVATRH